MCFAVRVPREAFGCSFCDWTKSLQLVDRSRRRPRSATAGCDAPIAEHGHGAFERTRDGDRAADVDVVRPVARAMRREKGAGWLPGVAESRPRVVGDDGG